MDKDREHNHVRLCDFKLSFVLFFNSPSHIIIHLAVLARKNKYDAAIEYWVTTRESGSYEEEHEVEEARKSTSKAFLFACSGYELLKCNHVFTKNLQMGDL